MEIRGLETHPRNRGRICYKGRVSLDLVYHPDRLAKPIKKKSNGTFAEVSYEQAIDEIAERMTKIKSQCGARSVGVWKGEALGFFQQEQYARRFIHAFGSPNYFSNDSQCFNGRHLEYKVVRGYWSGCPDFEHADLVIIWGSNPPFSYPPLARLVADGKKRGSRMIVIDSRFSLDSPN